MQFTYIFKLLYVGELPTGLIKGLYKVGKLLSSRPFINRYLLVPLTQKGGTKLQFLKVLTTNNEHRLNSKIAMEFPAAAPVLEEV